MVKLLNELSQTVETFETDEAFYRYLESQADEAYAKKAIMKSNPANIIYFQ